MFYFRSLVFLGAVSLLGLACVNGDGDAPAVGDDITVEQSAAGMVGAFDDGHGVMHFSGQALDAHSFDLRVEFHGMTLVALVDTEAAVVEHDGYASDNGEDTQMNDEDRASLAALSHALDGYGTDVGSELSLLRRFVNVWSEFPSSKELSGTAVGEADRSYTSICWAENSYQQVTHDDWNYNRWDDASTYSAYIGFQVAGPCSDGTYFWKDNAWVCYEPDHSTTVEYAYGGCFGRCGAGCGSSTQLTWDCADHDSCVRFGHIVGSFWCNDEFTATLDDWASAPDC